MGLLLLQGDGVGAKGDRDGTSDGNVVGGNDDGVAAAKGDGVGAKDDGDGTFDGNVVGGNECNECNK